MVAETFKTAEHAIEKLGAAGRAIAVAKNDIGAAFPKPRSAAGFRAGRRGHRVAVDQVDEAEFPAPLIQQLAKSMMRGEIALIDALLRFAETEFPRVDFLTCADNA